MVIISGLQFSFLGSIVDALTIVSPTSALYTMHLVRHFPSERDSLLTLQLHILNCSVGEALRMRELCSC